MVAVAEAIRTPRKRRLPGSGTLSFLGRLFRDKPLGAFGFVICVIFLFCGIFADVLAPYGYNQISPINRLKPPSEKFWLGTDNLGRDMLSRCLYGAQLSVIIGLSAAALATVVSIFIGIVSGYLGGKFDMVMQRFVDAWMCFPDLIILIVVVSVVGPGMGPVIVLLGLLYGIGGSRIIRGAVLSVRENAYVHAAQSTGASLPRILWRHILPNIAAPLLVQATYVCASAMITEAILSFIGAGTPPTVPSWGNIMAEGRSMFGLANYLILFPGICLSLTVLAVNLMGDGLRDALDPRLARRM